MVNGEWGSGNKRYKRIENLGKGRSSQTILAQLVLPNTAPTPVVIKQVYRPKDPLDDLTKRLNAIGQHPQLPALIDSWQTTDGQFLVFEYIAAPAITQVEPPPWTPAQVESWLLSLLPVLEHLHSFRLVHGDIRPANIRQGQRTMLVDFRITQRLDRQQSALVTTGGDAAYAAPEQTLGQLVYASDLYSLGLVAIHLLTGLAPFDLYSIADNRWIWPDLVPQPLPKNLAKVLHKLLKRSLADRYTRADQPLADLKKAPTVFLLDKARSFLPKDPLPIPLPALPLPKSKALSPPAPTAAERPPAPQIPWQPLYQFHTGISTALALQGQILAMGTSTGAILVCDLAASADIYPLEGRGHRDRIIALAFQPQTLTLYSASSDGTIKLWDLTRGSLIQTLSQHGWQPTDLAITQTHLIVSDVTGLITLWDLAQLQPQHRFNQHQDRVSAIAASGQQLVSISRDRTLRFWSLSDQRLLETLSISSSQGLALHPSGHHVIVGNDQGHVDVWQRGNPPTKDRLCTVEDSITTLALSPDARLLAVGTDGNTLRVYQGASGQCVSKLTQGWGVVEIAFDGHTLVSSSQDETVTVWRRLPQ